MVLFNRTPVAAGAFYPLDSNELRELIGELMPGEPYKQNNDYLQGMICPHAGYIYSGKTAAKAYYELSMFKPRTFVILGPNHTGLGERVSVMSNVNYQTPLGVVKTDTNLGREFCKNLEITPDSLGHSKEHSIEVQLPFLQYLYGDKLRILPIVVSDLKLASLQRIGSILSKTNTTIIASSDFTHHGTVYGYSPFKNVKLELHDHDMNAINKIQKLDVKGFYDVSKDSTICGRGPITILLQAMKERGARARFLEYSTSADVTKDYENVVSYASMIFK